MNRLVEVNRYFQTVHVSLKTDTSKVRDTSASTIVISVRCFSPPVSQKDKLPLTGEKQCICHKRKLATGKHLGCVGEIFFGPECLSREITDHTGVRAEGVNNV